MATKEAVIRLIEIFAAMLFAGSVHAAEFSAYDGSFTLAATDRWNVRDIKEFAGSNDKPALCLRDVSAGNGLPTLIIADIAFNGAYKPGSSLEDVARRDLATRRQKAPQARFTLLKPVRFRAGFDGYGFGMRAGDRGWDTFYFALGPKSYYATCRGDVEKECLAALSTIRSREEGAMKSDVQGPRVAPKSLGGTSLVVPPGWAILQDTPKLFLMANPEQGSLQLRVPMMQALLPDDPGRLAGAVQGGIKSACSQPAEGPSATASREIMSEKSRVGTLAYATCRDSVEGYVLSGVLSVASKGKFLVVAQSKTQDPTSRTLEVLSSLAAAR